MAIQARTRQTMTHRQSFDHLLPECQGPHLLASPRPPRPPQSHFLPGQPAMYHHLLVQWTTVHLVVTHISCAWQPYCIACTRCNMQDRKKAHDEKTSGTSSYPAQHHQQRPLHEVQGHLVSCCQAQIPAPILATRHDPQAAGGLQAMPRKHLSHTASLTTPWQLPAKAGQTRHSC